MVCSVCLSAVIGLNAFDVIGNLFKKARILTSVSANAFIDGGRRFELRRAWSSERLLFVPLKSCVSLSEVFLSGMKQSLAMVNLPGAESESIVVGRRHELVCEAFVEGVLIRFGTGLFHESIKRY